MPTNYGYTIYVPIELHIYYETFLFHEDRLTT